MDPLSVMGCFNCDDPGNRAKDCTKPKDFAKAAARKIEYLKKRRTNNAVHVVLAFLCEQLEDDDDDGGGEDDTSNDDDVYIFNSIMETGTADIHLMRVEDTAPDPNGQTKSDKDVVNIFSVGTTPPSYVGKEFAGACIDSGAQRTVIGTPQAAVNCAFAGIDLRKPPTQPLQFNFGNSIHGGLGLLDMRLLIESGHYVQIRAHVVDVDVPLLIEFEVLTELRSVVDFADDVLAAKDGSWCIILRRKLGHLYVVREQDVCFTESELRRLHRHFYHPGDEKLTALIARAALDENTPEMRSTVERIRRACDTCQRNAREPARFSVSMPSKDCVFNRTVAIDIMLLKGDPVLHCVDVDTKFSAAAFLASEVAANVWTTLTNIWANVYIGYPERIAIDQGSQFVVEEFTALCRANDVAVKASGVESHNALGAGERYHAYLRQVFRRVVDSYDKIDKHPNLRLAVKAANGTAGPHGLVPNLLVFGVLPRLPIYTRDLPNQRARFQAMATARNEMIKLTALARVSKALQMNAPAATDQDIRIGDDVLVYRGKEKRWLGPYTTIDAREKGVIVEINCKRRPFSIDKVHRYAQDVATQRAESSEKKCSPRTSQAQKKPAL